VKENSSVVSWARGRGGRGWEGGITNGQGESLVGSEDVHYLDCDDYLAGVQPSLGIHMRLVPGTIPPILSPLYKTA
jgi:hypothetical protein